MLVNKTLEQSIMEVEEEYELESMKQFKEEWYLKQEAQMLDWKVQVDEEWERWHEKERVVAQRQVQKRKEAEVLLKIQAMNAARAHLANLVPNAVKDLLDVASFPDAKLLAIERMFIPELVERVCDEVETIERSQVVLDDIVDVCAQEQLEAMRSSRQEQRSRFDEMERLRAEEMQIRKGNIRIHVDNAAGEKVVVGPVRISSEDDMQAVQDSIFDWLKENEPELSASWPWGVVLCLDGEPVDASASSAAIFAARPGQISLIPAEEPPPPPEPEETEEQGEDEAPVDG